MIAAIVLAAGLSTRMGKPKMLLPWKDSTVIGYVLSTLSQAGINYIRLVTGANHHELSQLMKQDEVELIFNKNYANGEMLSSIQVGLSHLADEIEAILVVLGDQPQIEVQVVRKIIERYQATQHPIIVPSFKLHRGHPWLLGKPYWQEICELKPPLTLRDFLVKHHDIIDYINVDTASVIQDLDTQEDYSHYMP